jgi:hypothetical protein
MMGEFPLIVVSNHFVEKLLRDVGHQPKKPEMSPK